MVGYLSGYWFDIVCDCKYFDWEDLIMAKKNKTEADTLFEDILKAGNVFCPLPNMDYSKYPEIDKFVAEFDNAHPHLAYEVKEDSDNYFDRLKKVESELIDKLLARTNLFKEFYEVVSMHFGIMTFYLVIIQMLTIKIDKLQEKLDRYENNN